MIDQISNTTHVARKKYYDDFANDFNEWVQDGCYIERNKKISFSDARVIVKWRNDPDKSYILPGMRYQRQYNKFDGETYVFRCRIELYELACKYNLFNEDY